MINKKYIFGALWVAFVSLFYIVFSFWLFDFSISFEVFDFLSGELTFYLYVFVKNFCVGYILMFLFAHASFHIERDDGESIHAFKGILFYSAYGVFAFLSFCIADLMFIDSLQGWLLILFNGSVEALIVTVPIRLLHSE